MSFGGEGKSTGADECGALFAELDPCPPHAAVRAAKQARTAIVAPRRRRPSSIESTRIAVSSGALPRHPDSDSFPDLRSEAFVWTCKYHHLLSASPPTPPLTTASSVLRKDPA